MSEDQQQPEPKIRIPQPDADHVEYRNVLHTVIVPTLQEAKPILEGVAGAYIYDKLTGGLPPPADPPPSDPPADE